MSWGIIFNILILLFLLLLVHHTYNELWEHHLEKRRAHAIVHAIFLTLAILALLAFVARIIIRNI